MAGITDRISGTFHRSVVQTQRGVARALNIGYTGLSFVRRAAMTERLQQAGAPYILSPEKTLEQTIYRVAPTMVHVVRTITNIDYPGQFMVDKIIEGVGKGFFDNYGEAIYLKPRRAEDFLQLLQIDLSQKHAFLEECRKHYLIYDQQFAGQMPAVLASHPRASSRGKTYIERDYTVMTRDGVPISFTRLVNVDAVRTNDGNPSVLLVTCIAGERATLDLADNDSPALDLSDNRNWVYLFEPRGVGKNKGAFDADAFVDTFVSNDLPAVTRYISQRPSTPKPVVLVGHSRGGMISKFMLIRNGMKLKEAVDAIVRMTGRSFSMLRKTRKEIGEYLDSVEASRKGADAKDLLDEIEKARIQLDALNSVKGVITLGSPLLFDKNSHPLYPLLLMLNHVLPALGVDRVPIEQIKMVASMLPAILKPVRMLINAKNFRNPDQFVKDFVLKGVTDISMGEGLQFLRAIYSGKGFSRMGREKENYTLNIDLIPPDIPIVDFVGEDDILCPPYNLGLVDGRYNSPHLDYSLFPNYSHADKKVVRVARGSKLSDIQLPTGQSYVRGYLLEGVGHLDFLYGDIGVNIVRPLVARLIEQMNSV